MKIIVTGGAGFIGSNLILYWLEKYPDTQIMNLDRLTYAANPAYLNQLKTNPNYKLVEADIANRVVVREIINNFRPDGILHLAAESHVDNSINNPEPFVLTNVVGTFNLLEEFRQLWMQSPDEYPMKRFHHISTDEVYGSLGNDNYFDENTPYAPNSPYSATKAGSDHLVRAYHHTYAMNTVMTNCSNNFGPNQHDEKLIPTIIRSAIGHKPIPIYGTGENIRDWLFVHDHCTAIDMVYHKGQNGESYNIGSRNEWKNIELARLICDIMNELVAEGPGNDYRNLITFIKDRPGHDKRYAINPAKVETKLGWKSQNEFKASLTSTIRWYLEKYRL